MSKILISDDVAVKAFGTTLAFLFATGPFSTRTTADLRYLEAHVCETKDFEMPRSSVAKYLGVLSIEH